jgi:hypothetical protein
VVDERILHSGLTASHPVTKGYLWCDVRLVSNKEQTDAVLHQTRCLFDEPACRADRDRGGASVETVDTDKGTMARGADYRGIDDLREATGPGLMEIGAFLSLRR